MLKWIINILLLYALYKLVKGFSSPKPVEAEHKPDPDSSEMVEDPQCGVFVTKESAIKGPGGTWFCSRECLDAYKEKAK